jgi:drug/metabolite transporter (DMT)-like permease
VSRQPHKRPRSGVSGLYDLVARRPPVTLGWVRREAPPGWLVWLNLWIVYIVWGSTYLGIRVVVETMPPLITSGARFMLAGAVMYTALLLRDGGSSLRVTRSQLLSCVLIGSALTTGGNGLVMVAEQDMPSALAALIMASIPLWVIVFRRVARDRIDGITLAGVAVGFGGVALLLLPGGSSEVESTVALFVCVIAAFLWASGTFFGSRVADLPPDPFLSTALQMFGGGLVGLLIGLAVGEAGDVRFSEFSGDSIAAFSYLVVVGSLVAFTAYVWLLQHAPVSKVATYAYVNPVVAIFLGWLILDEQITGLIIVAAAVIVSSVAVIVRRESAAHPEEEAEAEAERVVAA